MVRLRRLLRRPLLWIVALLCSGSVVPVPGFTQGTVQGAPTAATCPSWAARLISFQGSISSRRPVAGKTGMNTPAVKARPSIPPSAARG